MKNNEYHQNIIILLSFKAFSINMSYIPQSIENQTVSGGQKTKSHLTSPQIQLNQYHPHTFDQTFPNHNPSLCPIKITGSSRHAPDTENFPTLKNLLTQKLRTTQPPHFQPKEYPLEPKRAVHTF